VLARPLNGAATIGVVLALAGCGGGHSAVRTVTEPRAAAPKPAFYPDDPQVLARATTAAQRSDLKKLWRDTLGMRHAASSSKPGRLKGDAAVRNATSVFIDDLDRSAIDNLSKNRVIDHAAAAVATVCEQCFQQLEAMRPIPAIAH
jgi:hypothetical protein